MLFSLLLLFFFLFAVTFVPGPVCRRQTIDPMLFLWILFLFSRCLQWSGVRPLAEEVLAQALAETVGVAAFR